MLPDVANLYEEIMRLLTDEKDAVKVFVEVARGAVNSEG